MLVAKGICCAPRVPILTQVLETCIIVPSILAPIPIVLLVGGNNRCIPPTLEGWVYIIPIHGPLDGPLYTWAQYTPTQSGN